MAIKSLSNPRSRSLVRPRGSAVAIGTVIPFAGSSAPSGFIKCNGALVSRSAYAALFAAIGTTYGAGDGSTTFAVPDFRGVFLRGLDESKGYDTSRTMGSEQADAFVSHTHTAPSITSAVLQTGSTANRAPLYGSTASTGGTETRPKNFAVVYIIKAF